MGCLCDSHFLCLKENLGIVNSFLIVKCCAWDGVWVKMWLSFFYPFWCGHLLSWSVCSSLSTSIWVSLRGYLSMCRCLFIVYMEGRIVKSLLSSCNFGGPSLKLKKNILLFSVSILYVVLVIHFTYTLSYYFYFIRQ